VRLGLVSDVHANLEAFTAVLRELDRMKVDRIVCLGDVVGYHANPNECMELLERAGAQSIAGNHDRAAARVIEPTSFGAVARRAIHWTRRVLSPEWVLRLRDRDVFDRLDDTTCLVHAALHPQPNDEYHLTTPARIDASLAKLVSGEIGARLCFFGHTHQTAVHRADGRTTSHVPHGPAPARVELDDAYYLVNPGSVGQPRDGDERAAFAIFDDRAFTLEFRRVEYDRLACLRKAEAAGLLAAPKRRWPLRLLRSSR
jgi:predicted phosphodiesterase